MTDLTVNLIAFLNRGKTREAQDIISDQSGTEEYIMSFPHRLGPHNTSVAGSAQHHGHPNAQPQQHPVSGDAVNHLTSSAAYSNTMLQQQQQALNPAATHFNTLAHQQHQGQNDASTQFYGHAPTLPQQQHMNRQQLLARQQQMAQQHQQMSQQAQIGTGQGGYINPVSRFDHLDAMHGANTYPAMHQQQQQIIDRANQPGYQTDILQHMEQLHEGQGQEHGNNDHQAEAQAYDNTTNEFASQAQHHHGYTVCAQNSGQQFSQYPSPYPTPQTTQQQPPVYGPQPPPQQPIPDPFLDNYPLPPTPMRTIDQARTHLAALEYYKKHTVLVHQASAGQPWWDLKRQITKLDDELRDTPGWADNQELIDLEDRMDECEANINRIALTWDKVTEEIEDMYAGLATGEYE